MQQLRPGTAKEIKKYNQPRYGANLSVHQQMNGLKKKKGTGDG